MYGFEFTTKHGKKFELSEINPALFLDNLYVTGGGQKVINKQYPSLTGKCEVFAVLKSASMDDPYTSGPSIVISEPSSSPAEVTITISPSGSGSEAFYHFTIYARSIV
ncbi:hypothetical protein VVYB158_13025 [Vibrio vulnificus CladeA-yb158]|nr:hypothetical protein VVYB158_13025 [Vibrio vulnificus CladeA-yb158]